MCCSMSASVRLIIIYEVHLLNDDRGPVIEPLIARTQRQVGSDFHQPHLPMVPCLTF